MTRGAGGADHQSAETLRASVERRLVDASLALYHTLTTYRFVPLVGISKIKDRAIIMWSETRARSTETNKCFDHCELSFMFHPHH